MESFGRTSDGTDVQKIALENGDMSCEVLTYGATLRSLVVTDRNGNLTDVVLGYDSVEDYETRPGRMGATIGRYANRISDGRFVLDGRTYDLSKNRGPDHIHGGFKGFDRKVWDVRDCSESSVTLHLFSPDGEEGYPGNLDVEVTYSLDGRSLRIDYEAVSDRDTICSLTNHSYFNLNGHGSGTVEDYVVQVNADRYTPFGERSLPTGEIASVEGTDLDLREPKVLVDVLKSRGGYDNNFLLNGKSAAKSYSPITGISMSVETDYPAMQLYTANGLKDMTGKGDARYGKWSGLCFEAQNIPDAPNHEEFPISVLRTDEAYHHFVKFNVCDDKDHGI
jgi:aldose 1-epimerase